MAELLSRLPGFALELLQFALETANPAEPRILRVSRGGYQGCADCDQRAAVATAAAGFVIHVPHSRSEEMRRQFINRVGRPLCHQGDHSEVRSSLGRRPLPLGPRKTLYTASSAGRPTADLFAGAPVARDIRNSRENGRRLGPMSAISPSTIASSKTGIVANLRQASGCLSCNLMSARFAHFHGLPPAMDGSGQPPTCSSPPAAASPCRGRFLGADGRQTTHR
jgi:hypothetical protein